MAENASKIGFIGAGNMGAAMIGALVRSGDFPPEKIYVSDKNSQQTEALKAGYDIRVATGNTEIVRTCDIIVFAVKPQIVDHVLADLAAEKAFDDLTGRKLFISIAAGIRLHKFETVIYSGKADSDCRQLPILRVMPNTPALVQAGMSAVCANAHADEKDIRTARSILSAMGEVYLCDESRMDAITAISGSGPAYCFYLVESMVAAGQQLGLPAADAQKLTEATLAGALQLLSSENEAPETLRRKVTSPGGTTEAAIRVMDENGVKNAIVAAIIAAAERSRQLSDSA